VTTQRRVYRLEHLRYQDDVVGKAFCAMHVTEGSMVACSWSIHQCIHVRIRFSMLLLRETPKVRVGVTSKTRYCELFAILDCNAYICHLGLIQPIPIAAVLSTAIIRVGACTSPRFTSILFSFDVGSTCTCTQGTCIHNMLTQYDVTVPPPQIERPLITTTFFRHL
jgi:hypothetical protein